MQHHEASNDTLSREAANRIAIVMARNLAALANNSGAQDESPFTRLHIAPIIPNHQDLLKRGAARSVGGVLINRSTSNA